VLRERAFRIALHSESEYSFKPGSAQYSESAVFVFWLAEQVALSEHQKDVDIVFWKRILACTGTGALIV
jgi:hypothetical protein